jgi:hypothetical protein
LPVTAGAASNVFSDRLRIMMSSGHYKCLGSRRSQALTG